MQEGSTTTAAEPGPSAPARLGPHLPSRRKLLLVALAVVALLWVGPTIVQGLASIDISGLARPYLLIFAFVWWDAIIPVFPSESLLNTGSTLAASGAASLELWGLILAGAAGAVVGDSTLYWLARTIGRRYVGEKLNRARENPKVEAAFRVLGSNAPLLIVAGRFVPGVRFVINATMGLGNYPYRRFLAYSAAGGVLWSAYTCTFSYLVGSWIGEYALLSILISAVVTTAALAVLYVPLRRHYAEARAAEELPESSPS